MVCPDTMTSLNSCIVLSEFQNTCIINKNLCNLVHSITSSTVYYRPHCFQAFSRFSTVHLALCRPSRDLVHLGTLPERYVRYGSLNISLIKKFHGKPWLFVQITIHHNNLVIMVSNHGNSMVLFFFIKAGNYHGSYGGW